jgi:hypothetical protein
MKIENYALGPCTYDDLVPGDMIVEYSGAQARSWLIVGRSKVAQTFNESRRCGRFYVIFCERSYDVRKNAIFESQIWRIDESMKDVTVVVGTMPGRRIIVSDRRM